MEKTQNKTKVKKIEELDIKVTPIKEITPINNLNEQEILAWCEYYLNSKKIKRPLHHIKF